MPQLQQSQNRSPQLDAFAARGVECLRAGLAKPKAAASGGDRTRECVAYSGAKVDRWDWSTGEKYYLQLSLDPAAVGLGRVTSGSCPVLDDHMAYAGCESVLGIVESPELRDGTLVATLRFSKTDPKAMAIWDKIEDGIIQSVSVGVKIGKLTDISEENDKIKTYRADSWELMEISATPMPADMNAGFLSASLSRDTITLPGEAQPTTASPSATSKETIMDETMKTVPEQSLTAPPPVIPPATAQHEDVAKYKADLNEANRKAGILELSAKFSLAEIGQKAVADGISLEQFRGNAMDALAARSDGPKRTALPVPGGDEREKLRESISNAMLHSDRPDAVKLEGGREYVGMSMIEIARECLTVAGINTRGKTKGEIAQLAFQGTSDFPFITENVANKSLRAGYEAFPQTFRPVARKVTVADFKTLSVPLLSGQSALPLVAEHGEIKYGRLYESKNTVQVKTYGEIIPITRQAIINDDKGAFTRIPFLMGGKTSQTESNLVWGIITANAAMFQDGIAIFHATHANLVATGTAISVDNIGILRAMVRKQKDLDGTTVLNLMPKYIIAGTDLETLIAQLLTQITPATVANAVPDFVRSLIPVIEPRLDVPSGAKPWFMAADTAQSDGLVYAYLEGQEGAYTETRQGFEVDGIEVKARLDIGAAMIEHRSWAKNNGV